MSEQNRPEDSPKPITQTPVPHSGEAVKREFDLPLDQANEQNKLFVPDTIGQPIDLSGAPYMPFTERDEQEASETVIASYQPGTPEKKKMSLKAKLAWFGAGILTVTGLGIGANAAAEGPFMKAPTATAPANPNQGGAPLPAVPGETNPPVTQTPGENITYVPVTEADVKDYNLLVEDATLTYSEYQSNTKVLPVLVEKVNEVLNITLTNEEFEASKNMLSETGKTGPAALAEMKRSAYDSIFQEGSFKQTIMKKSEEHFNYWLQTRNEATPFKATFEPTDDLYEYAFVSNVNQNSLEDRPTAQKYRFEVNPTLSPVPNGKTPSDRTWSADAKAAFTKVDGTVPNP